MSNEVYKKNDLIYRCLEVNEDKCLVIDCVKRTLPCWVNNDFLIGFEVINEEELLKELGVFLPSIGD